MQNKPILIAEISANHCGKFEMAKKLIKCAKVKWCKLCKTSNVYSGQHDY